MRGKRSKAREAALKVLYQLDITHDKPEKALKIFFKNQRLSTGVQEFVSLLVQGTCSQFKAVDKLLSKYASNWSLERMAVVDRNILRLGIYELFFSDIKTPPKVVINEAVELAKKFGSEEASKFVNGVLDSVHKEELKIEKLKKKELQKEELEKEPVSEK